MNRFHGNPILKPLAYHAWESRRVFNAAACYADGRLHILYRAEGNDNISRIGYAVSSDGYHVDERLPFPVFEPANDMEKDGCEDPRLTFLDNRYIMTYTAVRKFDHSLEYQISLTSIAVKELIRMRWKWGDRRLPFPGIRNKDAVIFPRRIKGQYVMFHRIDPDICVSYSDDLKRWCDIKAVMKPRPRTWDSWKIGAAGPPIELNEGWLFIYHGVGSSKVYSLGVTLLDKDNPELILYRSEKPILTPVKDYERLGKVPNVVFSCGQVLLDDKLLIYYGGADSVLCVATFEISELMPKN
ncbi:MAG: glycosidase [Candidatus Ranarchaeia archaeon]